MLKQKLFFIFLCVFGCSATFAQTSESPYQIGEKLSYDAKISKAILRGIDVGDVSFSVTKTPDGKDIFIKSEAKSGGTLVGLLNFKFYERLESTVESDKLQIKKSVRRDEQNSRIRDSVADFDYDQNKVIFIETDPNDLTRPPRTVASALEENTQDFVSALYMLRSLPLAVGKEFTLKISDSGLIYEIPVKVSARERMSSLLGKKWCWRVEPQIFGDNRLIEQEGDLTIWITDDTRRIPVRARIHAKIGKIEVKLKAVEKVIEKK